MLINWIKSRIALPEIRRLDIDSPQTTLLRSRIIKSKPFLKQLYAEWYQSIADTVPRHLPGSVVEIGSGGGFLKDIMPNLVSAEVMYLPTVDLIFDGHYPPFRENSLRSIVMLDVFHHFSKARLFLSAAAQCVAAGGAVVMIEPWNSRWSRLVYRYLHHEPFEADTLNWDFPDSRPLSGANSALPWIVFERDRIIFEKKFPEWKIEEITLHTPFRYLLSGGVSLKSLTPEKSFKFWSRVESVLTPWMKALGMFAKIVLVRKEK